MVIAILLLSCFVILTGCFQITKHFKLDFLDDGAHLFIYDEEYIELYSADLWMITPEIILLEIATPKRIGTVHNHKQKYEIYQYEDLPIIVVERSHRWYEFDYSPIQYLMQQKSLVFPELSNNTIDGVNLIVRPGHDYLRPEYNANSDTINRVLTIIYDGEKRSIAGELKYTLLLISNDMPNFASWRDIKQVGNQYFIQVAPGNNYAPIPQELLEEIVGGPLPEKMR
jgi:hypothetical protein